MYGSLARKMDAFYAEGHCDMTISDREYELAPPTDGRLTLIEDNDRLPWRSRAIARLEELVKLRPNWDSYGGLPVKPRSAEIALQILGNLMLETTPAPSIVPTASGHVQLEWHTGGIDLEVEVLSPILLRASFEDQETGEEWARDFNVDLEGLSKAISLLSER